MKTIEQKAKAYNEALERAKKLYEQGTITESLSYVFPELKESEDELAWLTKYIEEEAYSLSMDIRGNEDRNRLKNLQRSLAWLEKQGEQKPADMVEPKFKVGDWVVDEEDNYVYQVIRVISNVSNGSFSYDLTNNGYFYSTKTNCHLWTIADAKDGDVLCYEIKNELRIFIYKNGHIHYHCCYYNGHLTTVDSFFVVEKYLLCYIHPATKEQRDLLFQKIGEALYEWDAKEKELKKLTQSVTKIGDKVWSEEDETNITNTIIMLKEGASHHFTNFSIAPCVDWLKSLKDRYTWKPSEEQIRTLEYYMHTLLATEHKEVLFGLYDDLKKLKGE